MIFGIRKIDNFDPYNVLLAIATNTLLIMWYRVTYVCNKQIHNFDVLNFKSMLLAKILVL